MLKQTKFAVFFPEFTKTGEKTIKGTDLYTVKMIPTELRAKSVSAAMTEAKALGARSPIVGPM